MEIIWTDKEDGCPLFGTIIGKDKTEDNFPLKDKTDIE